MGSNSAGTMVTEIQDAPSIFPYHPPLRIPTHHACDGYRGVLHIQSGDIGGASGTIFFQFVIVQLMWADMYNFKPWIHFNNISFPVYDWKVHGTGPGVNFTMLQGMGVEYIKDNRDAERRSFYPGPPLLLEPLTPRQYHFIGDGVWEHYFEPVSDFAPGDSSCAGKPYLTLDLHLIKPGLHVYAPWAIRMWRYSALPLYLQKPHLKLKEWLDPQRRVAAQCVSKYIRFNEHMKELAKQSHPNTNHSLGLHIRWSDKADGRKLITVDQFLPYVNAFVRSGGQDIYLATDSHEVIQIVEKEWPGHIGKRIRRQSNIVRSFDATAVFKMGFSEHRTNTEVLIDILALSQCTFLVHGLSAVSDSAMYLNSNLIDQSVDLEDPDHMSAEDFESLVSTVQTTGKVPPKPREWWNSDVSLSPLTERIPTNHACDGYVGILHIREGDWNAAFAMTFFHFVVNQLIYAEMNNLKPWIHFSNSTPKVWDEKVHGKEGHVKLTVQTTVLESFEANAGAISSLCPAAFNASKVQPGRSEFSMQGTGVWEHYLEQVSDFAPGDKSCENKPFVALPYKALVPGLHLHCSWSVRSWRYDELPSSLGPVDATNHHKWLAPMRQRANEIVTKYYRFRPHILQRAENVLYRINRPPIPCLGLHIRLGDKRGIHRSTVAVRKFTPYVKTFVDLGGKCVYLATDSRSAVHFIDKRWPDSLKSVLRTQGESVVRSVLGVAVPDMDEDHHRTNSEVLVDILALSKCNILLHGFSTVSEAAIYINPKLQNQSLNLEDPYVMSNDKYKALVKNVLKS